MDLQLGGRRLRPEALKARPATGEAPVQEGGMDRVDASLQGLEPVALLQPLGDVTVALRLAGPLEIGRGGLGLLRAQVGSDHAPQLLRRVGDDPPLVLHVVLGQPVGHVHPLAGHVVLPTVGDPPPPLPPLSPPLSLFFSFLSNKYFDIPDDGKHLSILHLGRLFHPSGLCADLCKSRVNVADYIHIGDADSVF